MKNERIMEAYKIANRYAVSLMRKYNVAEGEITSEDLVADFIVNFMEKGFDEKFDENVTSFRHFVWVGMRNILVSKLRKENTKPNFVREFEVNKSEEEYSVFDLIVDEKLSVEKMLSQSMIEEILGKVGNVKFGYGKEVVLNEEVYPSTLKSLVELFVKGYTKKELSDLFGVTAARVGQLLNEAVSPYIGALSMSSR